MKSLADVPQHELIPYAFGRGNMSLKRAWIRYYGRECLFCERRMLISRSQRRANPALAATIDHINATCFGGTDHPRNLQVICSECNHLKGQAEHDILDYLKRRSECLEHCGLLSTSCLSSLLSSRPCL